MALSKHTEHTIWTYVVILVFGIGIWFSRSVFIQSDGDLHNYLAASMILFAVLGIAVARRSYLATQLHRVVGRDAKINELHALMLAHPTRRKVHVFATLSTQQYDILKHIGRVKVPIGFSDRTLHVHDGVSVFAKDTDHVPLHAVVDRIDTRHRLIHLTYTRRNFFNVFVKS